MRTVIYSRVSTGSQECSNQTHMLKLKYPEAEVIEEIASGAKDRPKLEDLLNSLTKGDVLIVSALDRIGRSIRDVLDKMKKIQEKEVILISVREGLDLTTPIGRFSMTIVAAVAELERELISERTKIALKRRKDSGIKLGRPEYVDYSLADRLRENGKSYRKISKETGISLVSLTKRYKKKEVV